MRTFVLLWLFFLSINGFCSERNARPELFFSYPDMVTAALSPNGQNIAAIRIIDGFQTLVLIPSIKAEEATLLTPEKYTQKEASIRQLVWLDNRYLAVQLSEIRKGIKDLLDSKISRRLLILDTYSKDPQQRVFSVRTKGWLAHARPGEKGTFLYAKSGVYSKIYKISISDLALDSKNLGKLDKIDGGQFKKSNEIISISGYVTRWFWGHDQEVVSALNFGKKRKLKLTLFDENGEMTTEHAIKESESKEEKRLIPIALTDEQDTFYCLDLNEEESRSVYRVNFSTEKVDLAYEISAYEILDLLISRSGELLGVQVKRNGSIAYEYINDDTSIQAFNKTKKETPTLVSIYDSSADNSLLLAYVESHNTSGKFVLLDDKKDTIKTIGEKRPRLSNIFKTKLIESSFDSDGLKIPYLLSLPHTSISQPYPLIVMPHGGPIGVHDDRYHHTGSHFFAANGFAVLRVNFRGSSGHTSALQKAGKKEWGGKMLSDIHTAVEEVSKRKDIDSERICAAGFSYGGYASSMLIINHPDTYRCAVSVGGVSDVNLYINSPGSTEEQEKWLKEHVGDPESEYENLKSISPAFNLSQLKGPILIAHGFKDRVVDVEHAYRAKVMLEKYDKTFEWYLDEESGHHFSEPKNRILLFSTIIDFLKRQTTSSH